MDLPSSLTVIGDVVGCRSCRGRITTSRVEWFGSPTRCPRLFNVIAACDCPTSVLALPCQLFDQSPGRDQRQCRATPLQHLRRRHHDKVGHVRSGRCVTEGEMIGLRIIEC